MSYRCARRGSRGWLLPRNLGQTEACCLCSLEQGQGTRKPKYLTLADTEGRFPANLPVCEQIWNRYKNGESVESILAGPKPKI
jgi:hypothetical protein